MKFIAKYNLDTNLAMRLLDAVVDMVNDDMYYSKQLDCKYGTQLIHATQSEGKWTGFVTKLGHWDEEEGFQLSYSQLIAYEKPISWLTSNGNYEMILIRDGEVHYHREGRRHGISEHFYTLKDEHPFEITEYDSQRDDVGPFEYGLDQNV